MASAEPVQRDKKCKCRFKKPSKVPVEGTVFVSIKDQDDRISKEYLGDMRQVVRWCSSGEMGTCEHVYCYKSKILLQSKAEKNGYVILRNALKLGYSDVAEVMLNLGAPVNNVGRHPEDTPLHLAAHGLAKIVELLLSKGAIVNVVNEKGETPLHFAVKAEQTKVVKLLLSHDANANAKDDSGEMALHFAACNNSESIVEVLLSLPDIEVNCKGREGKTPLLLVIENRHEMSALAFLKQGADINLRDNTGKTALHYAVQNGLIDTVSAILALGADCNAVDDQSKTPLHLAVQNGETIVSCLFMLEHASKSYFARVTDKEGQGIVLALLDHGAQTNTKDVNGYAALHIASALGNDKFVSLLLERKADLNLKSSTTNTALHYASSLTKYNADLILCLLAHGADVNCENREGKTALHIASIMGDSKYVSVLLEHGSEVNRQDCSGRTALHHAAARKMYFAGLIQSLLNYNADVNCKDKYGKTALHIAAGIDHERCVAVLLKHGAEINVKDLHGDTALHCAVVNGCEDTVSCLLRHGADVNCKDGGKGVVHIAVEKGLKSIVLILLKHETTDVNLKDINGNTALHYAALKCDLFSLAHLLTQGADIDCKGMSGKTALHLATGAGHFRFVKSLLKFGADVNITANNNPLTPLLCAEECKSRYRYSESKEFENIDNIVKILRMYIIVLMTLNVPLNVMNMKAVEGKESELFHRECESELAALKISKLENGPPLSLYNMLTLKRNRLLVLVRNEVVFKYFLNKEYRPFTRVFSHMLALQFRLAKERMALLQHFSSFLEKHFSVPPGICVYAITDHLSNKDLWNFVFALRNTCR